MTPEWKLHTFEPLPGRAPPSPGGDHDPLDGQPGQTQGAAVPASPAPDLHDRHTARLLRAQRHLKTAQAAWLTLMAWTLYALCAGLALLLTAYVYLIVQAIRGDHGAQITVVAVTLTGLAVLALIGAFIGKKDHRPDGVEARS